MGMKQSLYSGKGYLYNGKGSHNGVGKDIIYPPSNYIIFFYKELKILKII